MRRSSLAQFLTKALLTTTALTPLVDASPTAAQGLPTGASVAYGSVGFQRSSGTLTINQGSQNAIVNYNSFSIGQRNTVNINQPNSSSALLNRVTGNTPSTIAGHLNANGQVYLINPNGIAITKTGVVKVGGGFVASSLGMSDAEFRKGGKKHLRGGGASAAVTNAGTITIGRGGYAALVGGEVRNAGTIAVPMGNVGLGSGAMATLDVSGDGFLQVALPTAARGNGALVSNAGLISAAGGTVMLDAATARAAARNVVNISGTIDAHSISGHNGSIVIGGGAGGTVNVSGTLDVAGRGRTAGGAVALTGRRVKVAGTIDASGRTGGKVTLAASDGTTITGTVKAAGRHGSGGAMTVTGPKIALKGATVDASGATGGGTVNIGGDAHGVGPLPNANSVTIDAASVIAADAKTSGNGGSVVVWSQLTTAFAGLISAKGGADGGKGGQVEVSSHGVLAYTGLATLTAAHGAAGTLLLDPYNVTISAGTNNISSSGTNPVTYTPTSTSTSTINATTLDGNLANANVLITTGTGGSASNGTITVSTPLAWSSAYGLTLTANKTITIGSGDTITASNGSLTLNSGTSSGITIGAAVNVGTLTLNAGTTISATAALTAANSLTMKAGTTISDTAAVTAGTFTLQSGAWREVATTLPSFSATNFVLSGGSFLRATGGSGTATSPYVITDVYGLQGIGTMLSSSFSLGGSLNASGTSGWNGGAGFVPIGTVSIPCGSACFAGTFNGNGYTISNLTINHPSGTDVGLFGGSTGSIGNITLANVNITGSSVVGALVGDNYGTISNSSASGTVTANNTFVGGLVGINEGVVSGINTSPASITGSSSTATLNNPNSYYVGGLAGSNSGTITGSFATGAATGFQDVGGLIGTNFGPVSNVYATGNVTGGGGEGSIGGLIGANGALNGTITVGGTVTQAYATGTVSQTNATENPYYVGGLIGFNTGAVAQSFATGTVTGQNATGGLVGGQFGGSLTNAYATGNVTGAIYVGGLVGQSEYGGTIGSVYAANHVSGQADLGALVGAIDVNYGNGGATITNGYWNTDTVGTSNGSPIAGIAADNSGNTQIIQGQTTVQLQAALPSGLNPTVWGIVPNQTYPLLLTQPGVISGTVEASYGGVSVGAGVTVSDVVNGTVGATPATTDVNGNYLFYLGANGIPSGTQVIVYTSGANAGVSYAQNISGAASGLNIYGTYLGETTAVTTLSSLSSGLTAAIGGNSALQTQVSGLTNRAITASGSTFMVDQALATGTLVLSTSGTVAQSAAITATGLDLQGARGTFTLTNASNAIGTLAANSGGVSVTGSSLTVGAAAGTAGIAATGAVTLTANALSINQPVSAPGQTVTIQPLTASTTLGVGTGSGSFNLPQATLGEITAGTLAFGSTASGTLTESGLLTIPSTIGTLSLVTGSAINIGGSITGSGLSLNAGGAISDTAAINVSSFTLPGGAWSQNSTSLPAFAATSFTLSGGTFLRVLGGTGTSGSPYRITDVYGLQGINGFATNSDTFVLANNIDASGTSGWNAGAGFAPIGVAAGFFGTLNGQGFAINNLSINLPNAQYVGLIGNFQSGTLENLTLTNANITGSEYVGGFAGFQSGGTFSNLSISGSVTGAGTAGGYVGGIIGYQEGTLQTSASAANVTGVTEVGGLAGFSQGTITQSYATGTITATALSDPTAGGLVGYNEGPISQSYATGAVNGVDDATIGGLVGSNNSNITNSYATGAVTATYTPSDGGTSSVGGLIGYNSAGTITNTYATGLVTGDPSAPGGSNAGALVGTRQGGTSTASYWDNQTSGQTVAVGGGGSTSGITSKTTMALQAALPSGFSNTIWGVIAGQTFPYLAWSPPIAISGTDYTTSGGTAVSGATVSGLVNGVANPYTATTNGSGTYTLYLAPGQVTPNSQVLVYTNGGASYDQNVSGAVSGLNIYGTYLNETTSGTTLSSLNSGRIAAIGSNTAVSTEVSGLANQLITATGASFTLDQAVTAPGAFYLSTTGTNAPLTVAAPITSAGNVFLKASGNLTIASSGAVSGASPLLATTGAFVNDASSTAVTATSGGWQVFSAAPAGDTFGGLDSGNTAIWNTPAGGAVTASGNRYVFATAPTLTVATVNDSKTYGVDATNPVAADYTITGFQPGVAGAYLGDTAATATSGAASVTSTGSVPMAGVGGYAYQIGLGSLASSAGYSFVLANPGTFTINSRAITVAADAQTQAYGNAVPTLTYSVGGLGLVNGDTLSGGLATTAGPTASVGSYGITQGTLAASTNYAITYTGANDVIGARDITVVANAQTQTYGNATPALTYAIGGLGLVNGDTLSGGLATTASSTASVGNYGITQGTLANGNYAISYVPSQLTVNPLAVSLAGTQVYNGTTAIAGSVLSVTNLVGTDSATVAGSGAMAAKDVGSQPLASLTGLTLNNANYTLVGGSGSASVTPATLTYAANAVSLAYGAPTPALSGTVTGFVGADTQAAATSGALSFSTTATTTSNVGTYAITGLGLSAANGDYVFSQALGNATALTVTPAALTISGSRTYDTTTGFATGQLTVAGGVNGETVGLTAGSGTAGSANVGSGTGTLGDLAVQVAGGNELASNYALPASGTLTITPATITVAGAAGVTKTYDGTAALPAGSPGFTASGIYAADASDVTVTAGGAAYAGANAGPEAVAVSGLTLAGAAAGNYVLSATGVTGSGTIGAATLTYVAAAASSTYGSTPTGLTGTVTGFVAGQTLQSATSGAATFGTVATGSSDVGPYAITGSGLTAVNGDYVFAQAAGNANALTLMSAALTITANDAMKTYGTVASLGTTAFTETGLVNGDTIAGVTLASTGAASTSNVVASPYAITASNATGSGLSNYTIGYVAGQLTVTPAALTITANNATKTYGTVASLGTTAFTETGLVNGDTIAGVILASTGAASTANVVASPYAITASAATGSGLSNYTIGYVAGALMVTPAAVMLSGTQVYNGTTAVTGSALAVTNLVGSDSVTVAGSGTMAAKDVGNQALTSLTGLTLSSANYTLVGGSGAVSVTPATLTYAAAAASSTYGSTPSGLAGAVSGFVGSDTQATTTSGTLAFATKATSTSNAGPYAITGSGLAAANGDYTFVQASGNATALTVTPAALTITANNAAKVYGSAVPALTATAASPVNAYPITASGAVDPNYTIGYVAGQLTVNPATSMPGTVTVAPPVGLAATGLGSTIDDALLEAFDHPGETLPFIASTLASVRSGEDGSLASQIVQDLSNPRFDDIIVCFKGACTFVPVPARTLQKTSQLETKAR